MTKEEIIKRGNEKFPQDIIEIINDDGSITREDVNFKLRKAYIEGLIDNNISLPSNLDEAAEKAALKAYPEKDALNKKATGHYDPNYPRRKAYQQGYEQAEKDLAALALGKLELS